MAKDILTQDRDILDNLSEALIVWETLDSTQVKDIIDGKDIGNPVMKSFDDDAGSGGQTDDEVTEVKTEKKQDDGGTQGSPAPA